MLLIICFAKSNLRVPPPFKSMLTLTAEPHGKKVGKKSRHLTGQAYSDRHLAGQLTKNIRKM